MVWEYDALRVHVEQKHPEQLEEFVTAWNARSESDREAWAEEGKIKAGQDIALQIDGFLR